MNRLKEWEEFCKYMEKVCVEHISRDVGEDVKKIAEMLGVDYPECDEPYWDKDVD